MKTLDVKQGSAEWLAARLGVVTASEADSLVTPLFKARTGEGVETFMYRKLCEKLLHWAPETGGSWEMGQGQIVETIARPWYAFAHDCDVATPGFIVSDDGRIGCSPDGVVGGNCGLEIKSPQPPQHLKYLVAGEVPKDYLAQIHFSMLVTGFDRWVFVSYSRQFPPLEIEVRRDEKIIAALNAALADFFARFDPIYARIKGVMDAENAAKEAAYHASEAKSSR